MLYFENDYCEGAHPAILQKLVETNFEKVSGYGTDPYCASAKEKIRAACACPEADVFFISGGTQANAVVIGSMLHRWEGVLAATTGHVAAHEAGAIEFTGHKVLSLPHTNGKVAAKDVENFCRTFYADANMDHLVFPGMVYISHPSEYGTLYTKAELEALSAVCHTYHMPLFMDGARLGYGLVSEGTDVTLADIARLTDVFYIGGTKVGALCGEAVVFPHGAPAHFMTMVKQQGALLAKGRLMGLQFDVLFTDGLYTEISKNAIVGFFMEKNSKMMFACDTFHQVHYQLIVVIRQITVFKNGSQFKLVGSNFIVAGLYRYAQLVTLYFKFFHESCDAWWNRTEVMIFQLLVLGRRMSHQGASC